MHIFFKHSLNQPITHSENGEHQSQNQENPDLLLTGFHRGFRSSIDSAGALIGSNDDLLTEILLRLPAASILRFKSVSKHWRFLLSHTHFTKRYDKLSKSPGIFGWDKYVPFDAENRSPPPFRSLDFCFDRHGIKILHSCNGLLLCSSLRGDRGVRKYYVFNPTTKQFAIIPSVPGGQSARKTICFMGLAFHQTDCVHYKVVCILALEPPPRGALFQIQIYSSDTGKWKISVESFPTQIATSSHGVYWNGALHWRPSYFTQLYFNIDVEQLQTMPLPVEMMSSETLRTMYFGESRGHLHLILYDYRQHNSLCLNVYEMLSDHSTWFVRYQVELDELPRAFPEIVFSSDHYEFEVIDVVRGEEEEDTFLVLIIPGKMITYNVHGKSFKHIFSLINPIHNRFYEGYSRFHRYTEALASF